MGASPSSSPSAMNPYQVMGAGSSVKVGSAAMVVVAGLVAALVI